MNKAKILLFFLSVLFAKAGISQEFRIEMPSEEIGLEELIGQLEAKYDLLFSYKQDDISGLLVQPPKRAKLLTPFLSDILKKSALQFEVVRERYVLLSKRSEEELNRDKEPALFTICGFVKDSLSGEPLMAANVYLLRAKKGMTTLSDGSFQLSVPLSAKTDTLVLSYFGYQEQRISLSQIQQSPCATILLGYFSFGDDFPVVIEYLTDGVVLRDNGALTQLEPEKTGFLPGQVEPDILNTIQFLPGVSSVDGTPSGISVQGGAPDQNLILWEDIPVYHTAHYFGTLTAFNPYIIDRVSVYAGGFGAEYGGRISSVIKLESEVKPQERNGLGLGTNLIQGFADGQFATDDRKLTALFSLRRSMTDFLRSPTFNNISKRVQQGILVQNVDLNRLPPGIQIDDDLRFFDTNLKLTYQLSDKDQLSAAGFYAKNNFADQISADRRMQTQTDTFNAENTGMQLSWTRHWPAHFSTKLQVYHTDYHYDYAYSLKTPGEMKPDKMGDKRSQIQEQQLHFMGHYQTGANHDIQIGYQLSNYDVAFDITKNNIEDGSGNRAFRSQLHVLYAKIESNAEKKIGANVGLRFNHYRQVGQSYLEPRLRLWTNLNEHFNLYISAGKYYQFLSQLIQLKGDLASIQTPVWGLAGSTEVPVLNANHLQAGMVYQKNTWLVDIQAYAKNVKGLTSLASDFNEGISNRFHLGKARIRGIDILLKKRWGHYRSWISYSLKDVEHEFPTFFDANFKASIDQPHSLQWANMWSLGEFEFSLGWRISSGRPHSNRFNFELMLAPPNSMRQPETVVPIKNDFNSERLPAEHQLDASMLYHFPGSDRQKLKGRIGLALYNIYHQRNIYARELSIDKRPNQMPTLIYTDKVNLGFTPSFIVRLEW